MDLHIAGVIAGWIVPAFLGGVITWLFERRPRLLSYFLASSAVTLKPLAGGQAPPIIHTHTVVVQNRGRKAAKNVRLAHNHLPAFSVFPAYYSYSVAKQPTGEEQIVFDVLPPRSQVQICYVYFPPLLYSQIHAGISSDDGASVAKDIVINPKLSKPLVLLIAGLLIIGAGTVVYCLFLLFSWWLQN